jgi:hypothetical protein
MNPNTTARQVQRARRDLFASLSNPQQISDKVEAYMAAIRRHRESIFADILRETRSGRKPNLTPLSHRPAKLTESR